MSLKKIDTILFDLNGTLYERKIPIEGANETIRMLRDKGYKLNFITNTDGRSVKNVYDSVIKMGLEIKYEELFTPVAAVKLFIEQNSDKSFYPLVSDGVLKDLENIKINEKNPDYVIIGDFSDKMSYDEINKVFRMIKSGAEIIALSKTLSYIDVDGWSINTGAFVKMFEMACDKESVLMGKPSREYFKMAINKSDSKPENTLVIGDDIKTDIFGANMLKCTSILVKTGCFNEENLEKAKEKPDYVVENVNKLPKLLDI